MSNEEFLEKIEIFLKNTGVSASKLGVMVHRDPNIIFDWRRGRESKEFIRKKFLNFINNYNVEESKDEKKI